MNWTPWLRERRMKTFEDVPERLETPQRCRGWRAASGVGSTVGAERLSDAPSRRYRRTEPRHCIRRLVSFEQIRLTSTITPKGACKIYPSLRSSEA